MRVRELAVVAGAYIALDEGTDRLRLELEVQTSAGKRKLVIPEGALAPALRAMGLPRQSIWLAGKPLLVERTSDGELVFAGAPPGTTE